MNELSISNDLKQIELEIQFHKENAGKSIWEIGRRLNHVKENDLAHGEFIDWLKTIEINQREAYRMMRIVKELPNLPTLAKIGSTALDLIATLPDDAKEEQLERIEQGDKPTVKELQEYKRQLKEKDQQITALTESYNELANQPKPSPVVKTVEKEVIPGDYEQLKREAAEAKASYEQLKVSYNNLVNKLNEVDENSRKYEELTQAIQEMEGKMDRQQKRIQAQKQVYELVDLSKELLVKISPIPVLLDPEYVNENPVARRELDKVATQVTKFLSNLNHVLETPTIIEGEIINE